MEKRKKMNILEKVEEELKCSKIDDMVMRCYVTVNKAHFWISDFVPAQPRNMRESRARVISRSLALFWAPKSLPYISCCLEKLDIVNFRLACNMVWGGAHPGAKCSTL